MESITPAIDAQLEGLKELNLKIHSNPELGYREFKAHDNIVAYLSSLGFNVKPHAYGLATALEAEYGSGGRLVVFNAEYDCLPDIGHACGHNLIATASIAAFIGLAAALKASGAPGRARLLGTPAEEGGGGKLKLIDAGAYRGVDACLMVHPAWVNGAYKSSNANSKLFVAFHGRTAHAAEAPWAGHNALDAATLAYSAISMMRQQVHPKDRIHAIIEEGGDRPNVIPHKTRMNCYCRSTTLARALALRQRAEACFQGAALATGCRLEIIEQNTYCDVRPNKPLCTALGAAFQGQGMDMPVIFGEQSRMTSSTDQGNVSYVCPATHTVYDIGPPEGCYNHTPGFTAAAITDFAVSQTIICGKALALVGWKALTDDEFNKEIQADFQADQRLLKADEEKFASANM